MAGWRYDARPARKFRRADDRVVIAGRRLLPHLLLVVAASGALRLAIDVVASFAALPSGRIVAVPYALAVVLLLAAAWALITDPPRGCLLAIGGAIVLGSWVAAIGYGSAEFEARATAVLALVASLSTLIGVTRGWALIAVGVLIGASAPLLYVMLEHPPLGLIACYAVMSVGLGIATIGTLPRAARRLPLPALIAIALVALIVSVIVLFIAYGAPLSAS
jgi:hypothetical protein